MRSVAQRRFTRAADQASVGSTRSVPCGVVTDGIRAHVVVFIIGRIGETSGSRPERAITTAAIAAVAATAHARLRALADGVYDTEAEV